MKLKQRKIDSKDTEKKVLIVCEGERTEPSYFMKFKANTKCEIVGAGCNTVSVVEKAIDLLSTGKFKEAWCVFDRDSFPKERVKNALTLARQNDINIAFSNESFELWYILHFAYLDTKITRSDYVKALTNYLGKSYKKNDADMYQTLLQHQHQAIERSKRLYTEMVRPGACECDSYPYTTIHTLVERLNKLGQEIGS
ncbi:abortive phage infection protein [Morganella morganii]|uniref:Abortive phage infection protein n=1 Tax=Morganella morganii TaxID=582 RepID=A0A8I0Q2Z5_MORMO|nr:abortive phage infection protein [Morganella morganii]